MDDKSIRVAGPPRHAMGILAAIGPGIIVTGSVIGSGELINTPVQAAKFGFILLWAVIISCVIKCFLQIEIGRHAVVHRRTPFQALNALPGWKLRGTSWIGIIYMIGSVLTAATLVGMMRASAGIMHNLMALSTSTATSLNIWTVLVFLIAWAFLWRGTYADLEKLIGILVATFSLSVIVGLFLLQGTENAITWQQIRSGMTFSLGDGDRRAAAIAVVSLMGALGATANELFMYPYWLLEKGYARQVGSPDDEGWVERARGWIRIMQLDVTACTLLATLATVGYFLLGAAVFHGRGSGAPTGDHIVEQLSAMYTESYGDWSKWVFQLGALGTLFSTLIVATAAFGRMWSDMLISLGLVGDSPSTQLKTQRTVVSIYLLLSLLIAILAGQPPEAPVIFGQFVAGMFCTPLMAIAICAMAFRTDRRLRMSGATAFFLVTTSLIFVGCVAANMIIPFLGKN